MAIHRNIKIMYNFNANKISKPENTYSSQNTSYLDTNKITERFLTYIINTEHNKCAFFDQYASPNDANKLSEPIK